MKNTVFAEFHFAYYLQFRFWSSRELNLSVEVIIVISMVRTAAPYEALLLGHLGLS